MFKWKNTASSVNEKTEDKLDGKPDSNSQAKPESKPQDKPEEKPTPAFLLDDYPFKPVSEPITDLDTLAPTGVLYEIKCLKCDLSIRSQGLNIRPTYERIVHGVEVKNDDGTTRIEGGKGCIGCGNRDLIIREVDMSSYAELEAVRKDRLEAEKKQS